MIWDDLIINAIKEDLAAGDVTTEAIFPPEHRSCAEIIAKEGGILSGVELAARVFELIDDRVHIEILKKDAEPLKAGDAVMRIKGKTRTILAGERLALNFLMRMSGIATATALLHTKLRDKGVTARISDTRKTTPLWRFAEKQAVRDGGGVNHRMNLSDAILVKDNHIKLAGSIEEAVKKALANARHFELVEVEVTNLSQIPKVIELGVGAILLDNFSPDEVREAVKMIGKKAKVEVSGGITPQNIESYAIEGVDIISVGWLTHSSPALNFALEVISEVNE